MRPLSIIAIALTTLALAAGCGAGAAPTPTPRTSLPIQSTPVPGGKTLPAPQMQIDTARSYSATIKTSKGTMEAELFAAEAPVTVNNFVYLARQGFYDGVPFHRIVRGFMVQTGDPTGTGTGGPGYRFADEPVKRPYTRGILAMANAGPNTNGSQFFIVHADAPLPPSYTIFGQLTSGLDVLDAIASTPVTRGPSSEVSQPTERVIIESVTITEK